MVAGIKREPWSLKGFVRAYDARADEGLGWRWGGEVAEAALRAWYESGSWATVAEFAASRYALDQEV